VAKSTQNLPIYDAIMNDDIFGRSIQIDKDRRNKMEELMEEYDRTVYFPALEQLRKDCEKKGHEEGEWKNNGISYGWRNCTICGVELDREEY